MSLAIDCFSNTFANTFCLSFNPVYNISDGLTWILGLSMLLRSFRTYNNCQWTVDCFYLVMIHEQSSLQAPLTSILSSLLDCNSLQSLDELGCYCVVFDLSCNSSSSASWDVIQTLSSKKDIQEFDRLNLINRIIEWIWFIESLRLFSLYYWLGDIPNYLVNTLH